MHGTSSSSFCSSKSKQCHWTIVKGVVRETVFGNLKLNWESYTSANLQMADTNYCNQLILEQCQISKNIANCLVSIEICSIWIKRNIHPYFWTSLDISVHPKNTSSSSQNWAIWGNTSIDELIGATLKFPKIGWTTMAANLFKYHSLDYPCP